MVSYTRLQTGWERRGEEMRFPGGALCVALAMVRRQWNIRNTVTLNLYKCCSCQSTFTTVFFVVVVKYASHKMYHFKCTILWHYVPSHCSATITTIHPREVFHVPRLKLCPY